MKKVVYYYSSKDFDRQSVGVIDLIARDFSTPIEGLDKGTVNIAAVQAYRAILKSHFPKYIDYII